MQIAGTNIQILTQRSLRTKPKFAIFDFDGTLSLIRAGWQQVMLPMMVDEIRKTKSSESKEEINNVVRHFVAELTGKQTIYQMIRLSAEIEKRGGQPEDPLAYKHRYHDLLMQHIQNRISELKSSDSNIEKYLMPGSYELLQALVDRDVSLFLASGTDENFVIEEVKLLGLDRFFENRVYGAVDKYKDFSKAKVIQNILDGNPIEPSELIGFGDGYVETENVKQVGGIAVGVVADEAHLLLGNQDAKVDQWKVNRLKSVGADILVPDFKNYAELVQLFWNE